METRATELKDAAPRPAPPPPPLVEPLARRPGPPSASYPQLSRFDVLPVNLLVDQVFSWLAPPASIPNDLLSRGLDPWEFKWKLFVIQQVCRTWHWHAKTLAARYAENVWFLHETDVAYHLVKSTRPQPPSNKVVQLQIALGCPIQVPDMGRALVPEFDCPTLLDDLYKVIPATDWTKVFRACPALLRLDLSAVLFHRDLLASILDKASSFCTNVKVLVFPVFTRSLVETRTEVESAVLDLLAHFLPRWKIANGGLLELSLPWHEFRSDGSKRRLIDIVARNCPRIRLLRGFDKAFRDDYRHSYGDYAENCVDANFETWRASCVFMGHLEELYWHILSDCHRYIQVFGSIAKPRLKAMHLAYVYPYRPLDSPGLDAATLSSVFKTTPNLEHFSFVSKRLCLLQKDLETPHDRFVTAIATHCPRLQSLRIEVTAIEKELPKVPMVTDIGMQEILRLVNLRSLSIRPSNVSTTAIVAMLDACLCRQWHGIEITLDPIERNYELFECSLQHLAKWDGDVDTARPRFAFRILNSAVRYPVRTRPPLPSIATRVHDKGLALGHDIEITQGYAQWSFCIRWNFHKEPAAPYRRSEPTQSQTNRAKALRRFVKLLEVRRKRRQARLKDTQTTRTNEARSNGD